MQIRWDSFGFRHLETTKQFLEVRKRLEPLHHLSNCSNTEERGMLVLSRQCDETIIIGDSIRITIVEVRGDKVRIGIEAPKDVSVHRQEIYDAIKREVGGSDTNS